MLKKCCLSFLLAAAVLSSAARADTLAARLSALLAENDVRGADVGISVLEITPQGTTEIFSHNGDVPLSPASNNKIFTTAAAFEKYGPHTTFKTRIIKVNDDLVLVGSGDPGLGDPEILKAAGLTADQGFDSITAQLTKAGITSYRNLIIDDRVFDFEFLHPNWPANQKSDSFEARIGALNFADNLKNGAVVPDPGAWAGSALKERLTAAGIKSTGALFRVPADAKYDGTLVAVQETPIISVITRANTNSINMMAEGLCKRLGHDATNQPGSWQNGTAAVQAYLKTLKIPAGSVTLDDGSGLSDKNKATARAFTLTLAHVAARSDGDAYIQSFATPGSGSLLTRFKDAATHPAASAIHAKTGHISNVSTLSGYIEVSGRRFAFSILCNNYYKSASAGSAAVSNVNPWQDRVCAAIVNWAK